MVCPFCFHAKTEVYNTRAVKKTNGVWRRRHCPHCGKNFTTNENIDPATILHILNGKKHTEFSKSKLLLSILKACDHRTDNDKFVFYLCGTIEQALYQAANKRGTITPADIADQTAKVLKRFDAAAYIKYLSYHQQNLDAATLRRNLKRS